MTHALFKLCRLSTFSLLVGTLLAGCASLPSAQERNQYAADLAAQRGWQGERLPAGQFTLMAFLPSRPKASDLLTVYIEGDGMAWLSSSQPSLDPTPRDPVGLRLALAQPSSAAAYLGRPCQYIDAVASGCASRFWTSHRFNQDVIFATGHALDALKQRFGATRLTLVGYSGGAAVATLVAAMRQDIEKVITVAGNLDHRAWTTMHQLAPLTGSLNPSDEDSRPLKVQQWHFVGGGDTVITPQLVQSYAARLAGTARQTVRVVPSFTHQCCWAQAWPRLWDEIIQIQ